MRILYLTSTYPYPPNDGYRLRCYNILYRLAKNHEVFLLSFSREIVPESYTTVLEPYLVGQKIIQGAHSTLTSAFKALFREVPFHVYTHDNKAFFLEFKKVIDRFSFDIVYTNFMYFTPYIINLRNDIIKILDQHNVDHDVWEKRFRNEHSWPHRLYAYQNYVKTRRYEKLAYKAYDIIISVSEIDKIMTSEMAKGQNLLVVPNGVDYSLYQREHLYHRDDSRILFVGSDMSMNIEAIRYFVERIFPKIRAIKPEAVFVIAGKIGKKSLRDMIYQPGVKYIGPVGDVVPELCKAGIFVAPFKMGGGTKLKVLEAMAAGCALVTTSIGCQGISIKDGEHALIADDEDSFAEAVIKLINNNGLRMNLARNAKDLIIRNYNWDNIVSSLNNFLLEKVTERRIRNCII